jgi:hypothetical protein
VLAANDADRENAFTPQEYNDVELDDDNFVDQGATDEFAVFLFKDKNTEQDTINVSWIGKSTLAPSTSIVKLQIYNRNSTTWEDLDSDNATAADTEFTLTGTKSASLGDYFDASFWIACRIWQEAAI